MALLEAKDIEDILNEVVDTFLIPRFMELGMNATGNWLQQLEIRSEVDENFGIGVIRGEHYSEYLALGRMPNKVQDTDALRRWAYGMANSNPEFMAWLEARGLTDYGVQIAYKIGQEGTSWYKQGGTDLIEILSSKEVVEFITERISVLLISGAKAEIQRELKELVS